MDFSKTDSNMRKISENISGKRKNDTCKLEGGIIKKKKFNSSHYSGTSSNGKEAKKETNYRGFKTINKIKIKNTQAKSDHSTNLKNESSNIKTTRKQKVKCSRTKLSKSLKLCVLDKKISDNRIELTKPAYSQTDTILQINKSHEKNLKANIYHNSKNTEINLLMHEQMNKPNVKKIKKKLKISAVVHSKVDSSYETEGISCIKKPEISNNNDNLKMKKFKKKFKEISAAEHLKTESLSDSIDETKINKKALLKNIDKRKTKKIKKKFEDISDAEHLKTHLSSYKEEPTHDFIEKKKVSKRSLLNKNDDDKPKVKKNLNKLENISSKVPPGDESDSSIEVLHDETDEENSEEDEELASDLRNSKEFKNLMSFIEGEKKIDPIRKIVKKAECETKQEFTFEGNDQAPLISPKVNQNSKNKFIVPLNTKQNVSLKTNSLSKSDVLKSKAQKCLQAARFRLLNEKLYTVTGKDALEYFKVNIDDFKDYHEGYQSQVMKWPVNPVDVIIKDLYHKSTNLVIADMGCGEAKIATTFPDRKIYSFDLVALNAHVTRCEFSKVHLSSESVDIVIFCLSLMGTNLKDYLCEAHRILKIGGELKIAEVESRIENLSQFVKSVEQCGFKKEKQNVAHKVFVFLDFSKGKKKLKRGKVPTITLKACMYKKR